MAEGNGGGKTTMLLVIGLLGFCCLLSAGAGLFVYLNDDANAWFKKTFGIGDDAGPAPEGETPTPTGETPTPTGETPTPTSEAPTKAANRTDNFYYINTLTKPNKSYVCPNPAWTHWGYDKNRFWCCANTTLDTKKCKNPIPMPGAANQTALGKITDQYKALKRNNAYGDIQLRSGKCPCKASMPNSLLLNHTINKKMYSSCLDKTTGVLKQMCLNKGTAQAPNWTPFTWFNAQ